MCDLCADGLISAATGWPRSPSPPAAEAFRGLDGVQHRMLYSVLRTTGGIEVLADEDGWAVDDEPRLRRGRRRAPTELGGVWRPLEQFEGWTFRLSMQDIDTAR